MKITYKVIHLFLKDITKFLIPVKGWLFKNPFLSDGRCLGFGQYREAKIDIEKGKKKRSCGGTVRLWLFWGGANLLYRIVATLNRVWIRSLEPFGDTRRTFDASSGPSHARRCYSGMLFRVNDPSVFLFFFSYSHRSNLGIEGSGWRNP